MAVRVKHNSPGVRDLLRSPGVMADLRKRAERIKAVAGPGHEIQTRQGRNRARATVRTTTTEAAINEQAHKTLSRAIGAGRG